MNLDLDFRRRLDARIDKRLADVTVNVTSGALEDGSYKDQCGYIRALREVKQIAQEIETLINEGK